MGFLIRFANGLIRPKGTAFSAESSNLPQILIRRVIGKRPTTAESFNFPNYLIFALGGAMMCCIRSFAVTSLYYEATMHEEGPPRLGDLIDDHCPRCKLLLNHAIASLMDGRVAKV